jgi:hypothetical protein
MKNISARDRNAARKYVRVTERPTSPKPERRKGERAWRWCKWGDGHWHRSTKDQDLGVFCTKHRSQFWKVRREKIREQVEEGLTRENYEHSQYVSLHKVRISQPHSIHEPQNPGTIRTPSDSGKPLAENECEHGRLPGDPCPSPVVSFRAAGSPGEEHYRPAETVQNWPYGTPCGCWPQEAPRLEPGRPPISDRVGSLLSA